MSKKITRRDALKLGAGVAAAATIAPRMASGALARQSGVNISGAKITFLTPPDLLADTARECAAEYEKLYGATVEFSLQPTLDLRDKLLAEYAGQTGAIDIVTISPWWLGDFGAFLEPIDQYLNDPAVAMPDFDFPDYDPVMLKAYTTFEEKLVGLPVHADHMMLLYRTDLFEDPEEQDAFKGKYGVDLAVPKNWADFVNVAEFFTRPDQNLWGHAVMGKRTHQAGAQWINRIFGYGGSYFDENGVPVINSEAGVKSLANLVTAGTFAPAGYLSYDFAEARQAFWEGNTAMFEAWPGSVIVGGADPANSKIVGKFNGTVMPGGHGCGGGWFAAISADSKNKVAAFKFLELLCSKKWVQRAFELDGMMPGRLSPYNEEYVQTTLPTGFAEQFGLAFASSYPPPNRYPEDSELKTELDRYVSEAMSGLAEPQAAMDSAQKAWEEILKRTGRI